MFEKEPQFFKTKETSKKIPEEASKEALESKTEIKGEISQNEKFRVIKKYVETIEEKKAAKEIKKSFLKLTPDELETSLSKKESDLIYGVISEYNTLLKHFEENNIKREEIKQFLEEKGEEMLPYRIRRGYTKLDIGLRNINNILFDRWLNIAEGGFRKIPEKFFLEELKTVVNLEIDLADLISENAEWKEYSINRKEKTEKPIEIKGFEKFDFPQIKGKEIVETATALLPKELFSNKIRMIEYQDKIQPVDKKYGFTGERFASFSPLYFRGKDRADIAFYKVSLLDKISYLKELPFMLAHEWAHNIDPRLDDQKDLLPGMQLQMVKEWDKARMEELEWSSYVLKINNPDKKIKEGLKSQESFAESCACFLENPEVFNLSHPKRYEFFSKWLSIRFPELDLTDRQKQEERYKKAHSFWPKITSSEEEKK
ncbi:MAG: hypothetical protein KY055_01760 [Candidatus Nealsonbacteria bacterium]|nr:hypothetical protein [Candidatus Nealsonbacteria bacterium]